MQGSPEVGRDGDVIGGKMGHWPGQCEMDRLITRYKGSEARQGSCDDQIPRYETHMLRYGDYIPDV